MPLALATRPWSPARHNAFAIGYLQLKPWLSDVERRRIGPPLAWAIGVSAIASVFAVVVIIVNYAPLNTMSNEIIRAELPAARYGAIGALIKASGQACERVCGIEPADARSGPTALDVECGSGSGPSGCSAPIHYTIAVARTN